MLWEQHKDEISFAKKIVEENIIKIIQITNLDRVSRRHLGSHKVTLHIHHVAFVLHELCHYGLGLHLQASIFPKGFNHDPSYGNDV